MTEVSAFPPRGVTSPVEGGSARLITNACGSVGEHDRVLCKVYEKGRAARFRTLDQFIGFNRVRLHTGRTDENPAAVFDKGLLEPLQRGK